jgi:hypothetical protein
VRAAFVDSAHSVMWGESVRDKRNRKVVTDTGFSEKWIFLLEQVPRGRGLLGSSLPDASRRHDEAGQRFRNGGLTEGVMLVRMLESGNLFLNNGRLKG